MLTTFDLNGFLTAFRLAASDDDLKEALIRATHVLGFAQFAMGHHVDLSHPPMSAIRLSTYDDDWVSHVLECGYFTDDPIHLQAAVRDVDRSVERRKVGGWLAIEPPVLFGLVLPSPFVEVISGRDGRKR